MDREILFKAKHIHAMSDNGYLDGPWIEGYLSDEEYISNGDGEFLIDKDTVCQYTGLIDKSGNKIWENDVIRYYSGEVYAPVKFGEYQNWFDSTSTCHVGFYVDWDEKYGIRKDLGYWINIANVEVVGNIFDNPELMKEKIC